MAAFGGKQAPPFGGKLKKNKRAGGKKSQIEASEKMPQY